MTKNIKEIYFNKEGFTNLRVKEFQNSLDNFLAGKEGGLYTKALNKTFQKLEPSLKEICVALESVALAQKEQKEQKNQRSSLPYETVQSFVSPDR